MQAWGRLGALLTAAGAAAFAPVASHAEAWRFRAEPVLGTTLDMVAVSADRTSGLAAAHAARAEIARLDAILSGWREDSELARLNAAERLPVSPELYAVLDACERWRTRTDGAFDARQGEAFALRRAVSDADPDEITRVRAAAAAGEVRLDPATRTVERPAAVRFAPEALAKGYVVDAAMAAARAAAPGLQGLMMDIGGDLRCWGQGPNGQGWTVGLAGAERWDNAAPAVLVRADDRALATSGPRHLGDDHILGGEDRRATVAAPTAAEADALATALCAMPAADGLALVETLPGVEARLEADGRTLASSGWDSLILSPADPPPRLIRAADATAPAAAPWPAGFALTIAYQLPRKGPRAYSPYVAVWITDESSRLVRALTMLGGKLDYVNENYIWWRRYGRSHPQIVAAITRPTRPPGRYTMLWDGKDDMGMPVGQGRYTVHVEATREDGLHSYQSMDMMLGTDPIEAAAPQGGDELGPTSVRYRRP